MTLDEYYDYAAVHNLWLIPREDLDKAFSNTSVIALNVPGRKLPTETGWTIEALRIENPNYIPLTIGPYFIETNHK